MPYDYIIIGAGITGITAAEQLANMMNKKVLLIEKNDHIGGNCYDYYCNNGTRVNKYGPHIFHTDNSLVYEYLSLFTMWDRNVHKFLFKYDNTLIPVPFNFISVDKLLPEDSEKIKIALLDQYNVKAEIPIKELMESENEHIRKLGEKIYIIFSKYLKKVYDINDEEVLELIDKFIPFRTSYDCRYYKDVYQAIPRQGYTNMFNNMLSNNNITIMLNKDYHDVIRVDYENKKIFYEEKEFDGHLIFTGMIDEFFNYKFGKLPYKSSVMINELVDRESFQDIAVTYYPEENHFSRIIDYKYFCGEYLDSTVIQFEYPDKYNAKIKEQSIPFYPVILEKNRKIYKEYEKLSKEYDNVTFIGRLSEYKILQMDEAVEKVLNLISEKYQ